MALVPVLVRLPAELVARVDAEAGAGRRAAWIRAALEEHLERETPVKPGEGVAVSGPHPDVARALKEAAEAPHPADRVLMGGEPSRGAEFAGLASRVVAVDPDGEAVLGALRGKRRSERMLRDELGWTDMRVSRAVMSLQNAGLIRACGEGMLEAV